MSQTLARPAGQSVYKVHGGPFLPILQNSRLRYGEVQVLPRGHGMSQLLADLLPTSSSSKVVDKPTREHHLHCPPSLRGNFPGPVKTGAPSAPTLAALPPNP